MTNRQVAWLGIIGFAVFLVAYMANENYQGVFYYLGLVAFYVSVIWSWVILFKK